MKTIRLLTMLLASSSMLAQDALPSAAEPVYPPFIPAAIPAVPVFDGRGKEVPTDLRRAFPLRVKNKAGDLQPLPMQKRMQKAPAVEVESLAAVKARIKTQPVPVKAKMAAAAALEPLVEVRKRVKTPPLVALPPAKASAALTPFKLRMITTWEAPEGEYMKTMRADIQRAEATGDTATYNRLTREYAIWADKYLTRGSQFENKQTP